MNGPWSIELWRLALLIGTALLAGVLTGRPGWFLAGAFALYAAWHLRQLWRLMVWLRADKRGVPPESSGVWGELFAIIRRLLQTNRKRKKKLASMLTRFQRTSAALPDGIVVIDAKGEIEWLNGAASNLFGLRFPQDVGRRITQLIRHPDFIAYLSAETYSDPLDMPSPADASARLSVRIVPYGKKQRLISARDITRLHKLEGLRRDFIGNVSHELRTPLTVITGYLETLLDQGEDYSETDRRILGVMHDQAERMRRIVDDLLMLSRLETTAVSADEQAVVSVPVLIQEVLNEARGLSREGKHQFSADIEPRLWLRGNSKELHSAFSNLVSNAVRYSPDGGRIHLSWKAQGAGAGFSVKDEGLGIEAMHIERLTERFYRVNKDRSRGTGGTGLGLAIVKHVLQRHEGRLEVESEPGKGSCFTCLFPQERVIVAPTREAAVG